MTDAARVEGEMSGKAGETAVTPVSSKSDIKTHFGSHCAKKMRKGDRKRSSDSEGTGTNTHLRHSGAHPEMSRVQTLFNKRLLRFFQIFIGLKVAVYFCKINIVHWTCYQGFIVS